MPRINYFSGGTHYQVRLLKVERDGYSPQVGYIRSLRVTPLSYLFLIFVRTK